MVGTIALVQGTRKIPVQYAKRVVGNRQYGGVRQYIPLKVNAAGVMPIIFAQAIMFLPITIAGFRQTESLTGFAAAFTNINGFWYNFVFFILIILFTYFYTAVTINCNQMAEDSKKNGGFIPGVKPGKKTAEYLDNIMSRITLPGSIFLAIVAIMPALVSLMGVSSAFAHFYGGTSLLILVGVVLDTLQQIESHLLMHHYDGITAVFPNRRARLFFDEELSRCCTTPVWSPEYTTISDLFQSQSDLRIADRVELVTILYDIYCRIMHSTESLDSFWSWGELMISDFDDIDRNMALSGQLFQALSDQKELSDMSFLTEEQADALTRFFGEMKDCAAGPGKLKKEYDRIWKSLGEIYTSFSAELSARGLAYSGMLQRRVIENLDTDRFTSDRYAFIGFNSLDKAEKALFSALRDAGKAVFYWDHDEFYTGRHSVHEAGRFMRENLTMFPGELDGLPLFDNLGKEKQLTIIETSTDNAQARYIPQWLESLGDKAGSETAIVLCDETLLQPVLHCIPADRTAGVNITMGYPMSQTPLFSLVSALLDMQRTAAANGGRFTLALVSRVLANPLVSCLSGKALETLEELRAARRMYPETGDLQNDPVLSSLFRVTTDNTSLLQYILDILKSLVPVLDSQEDTPFKPLMQESLYRTYTQTNRLRTLIEEGRLNIQTETLCRLVRTMLASTTVPFHGEPAVGMQIMGLIETRNLDFRN